ncbi:MAG: AsmA family protein [Bryobacteraceae bacterium]|jgi:AsmA protein
MKRVIQAACIVAAVLVLLLISLPFLVNANQFRPRLEADLTSALGRQVALGNLSFSLFSGTVKASDLSVADDPRFGSAPFIRAKSLDLGVDLWPLITAHKLSVRDLTVTEPDITLVQNAAGVWNFSTAGSKKSGSAPLDLSVKVVSIARGRLSIGRLGSPQKPMVLDSVDIALKDFAPGTRFPFSFTAKLAPAGDIKLDGTAGPINPADASLTPVQLNLKISGVDLAGLGITANSGVAGLLSIDGSGGIDGTTLNWKGLIRLDQAKFVPQGTPAKQPVEIDFSIQHNLQTHSGVLSQGDIRLGKAPASLTGSYTEGADVTAVNLHLTGSAMPVSALAGMLPPFDVQLPAGSSLEGGTASVNMAITGPATAPVVAGTVSVNGTKLKGFDLGSKVSAVGRVVGFHPSPDTVIQTLSASLHSDPRGTTIQNLKFIAPALGEVDGAGTISAKHDLDFKMRATLQGQEAFKLALGSSIPFFVQGTSTNPVIRPDVAGIAASAVERLGGKQIGGVDAGQVFNDLFGGGKKKQ